MYTAVVMTMGFVGIMDTHKEKLGFIQFSTKMASWLVLTFLICLHNQLSYIIYSIITY